jgi:DNA-binding NtrC family response regulator
MTLGSAACALSSRVTPVALRRYAELPPERAVAAASGYGPPLTAQFFTRSEQLARVLRQVERYARYDDVVLLLEGETGTGKSLLARHVHQRSRRAAGLFREVPLSAVDDQLASSDLFGHVVGAFTDAKSTRQGHFASAAGGTLFLDEIGKASPAVQKKLLVAIERKEIWPVGADRPVRVDVRLIAASNVALSDLVARGEFFPDLYARLAPFRVRIPPLRERRADIPHLVDHFVRAYAAACGYDRALPAVDAALMRALERAEWPHNVRELEGTIRRLLIDADGARTLRLEHCTAELEFLRDSRRPRHRASGARRASTPPESGPILHEREAKAAAARRLGVSRTTVYRWLAREAAKDVRSDERTGGEPRAGEPRSGPSRGDDSRSEGAEGKV